MKKSIILSLLAFMSMAVCAQETIFFEGLWYTINSWDGSATVVANPTGEGYSGEVVIPDIMTTTDGEAHNVTRIGYRAFCGTKILSVTTGKNVTSIDSHAFSYSTVASAIIGGELDETQGASVWLGDYAFYACDNLATVIIGDNVYSISRQAFQNCPSLSCVVLGKSVRWINASAFLGCKKLKEVYCMGEDVPVYRWGQSRFFDDDLLGGMTLYVPEFANFKNSEPWVNFGTIETLPSTELVKCATPQISYANGTVSFTCATEGAQFNSSVEYVENEFNNVSEYTAPSNFRVKVVAVKSGFLPSDVAQKEFALESYVDVKTGDYKQGDVNKDGNVNVADHVKLSDVIMNK